jgi:hypothetical protein
VLWLLDEKGLLRVSRGLVYDFKEEEGYKRNEDE